MSTKLPEVQVDTTHINRERLDQINEIKREFQTSMPVVELLKIKASPNSFMGLQRDQQLGAMGYTRGEIEKMTGFKRKSVPERDDDAEIFISDKDRPDELKALITTTTAEFESEYERILKNGIALGTIEENLHPEPKIKLKK
jgi:hypothetical protein